MNLRLDWCSHEAAAFAVEKWHYSRRLQMGKSARIGVWEDGQFIGVIVFTMGSGGVTNWATKLGITKFEMAELARIALKAHVTPVSRLIAIAIRMLRKQSPGLRALVSYADPHQGHHGGIYQASGWMYVGQSAAAREYIGPDGIPVHERSVSPTGVKIQFGTAKRVWKTSQCQKFDRPAKHKYVFPFDDEIRERLKPLAKPYPKRVRSETGDTADVQSAEGGSTPTRTLQAPELCS